MISLTIKYELDTASERVELIADYFPIHVFWWSSAQSMIYMILSRLGWCMPHQQNCTRSVIYKVKLIPHPWLLNSQANKIAHKNALKTWRIVKIDFLLQHSCKKVKIICPLRLFYFLNLQNTWPVISCCNWLRYWEATNLIYVQPYNL